MDEPKVCVDRMDPLPEGAVERMALLRGKLWGEVGEGPAARPGAQPIPLQVAFLDGAEALRERVRRAALEWTEHAHLRFFFGVPADVAQIRISFSADAGSWSFIGTDCLTIQPPKPTMNFGWLAEDSTEEEVRRVVLHEFGHALGCIHEHNHPAAGIPWNKKKVYAHYRKLGWSRADVDRNLFSRYSKSETVRSRFDDGSIMLYPVDPKLTDGKFSAGWNTRLSEQDRAYIARTYPKP